MLTQVEDIFKVVNRINPKPCVWSYLTSIEYMLRSKIYMSYLLKDTRLVNSYALKTQRHTKKKVNILDIGTGSGIFSVLLRKQNQGLSLWGLDAYDNTSQKNPDFHDTVKQQNKLWKILAKTYRIKFSHYDGLKIPAKNGSFDIITAYAVIEHVYPPDLDRVLTETRRVLKKGGHLFIFKCPRTLALNEYFAKLFHIGAHDTLFSDGQVKDLFKKHRLEIVKYWRSDMVVAFPAKFTNPFYRVLSFLDEILINSPFQLFAHHNNLILKKH